MYHASHNRCHTSLSFPTSDLRSAPLSHFNRPVQSQSRSLPQFFAAPTAAPKYSTTLPPWKQIEPGVFSDGTHRVLSAAYPPVQQFLTAARATLALPASPSDLIFTIAALEVFYSRHDPVHWMFWSDDKKIHTANIVNRVALHQPQVIRSKVAWNGIPEYLFILAGLHGSLGLPTDKEWWPILCPSKVPPPPMNLRKRKVQQVGSFETPEDEEGSEVEERRPKRSKTRPTRVVKRKARVTPDVNPNSILSIHDVSPTSTMVSLPIEDKDTLNTVLNTASSSLATPHDSAASSSANPESQVKPSRQKPTARQISATPDPSALPRALSPASDVLTPAPTISHTRNRSTSQASSQTLVSANDRRSVSVLSNLTAVESQAEEDKTVKMTAEQDVSDSEEADGKEDEESTGMVTRGRASKARSVVQQSKPARATKPRAKRRAAAN